MKTMDCSALKMLIENHGAIRWVHAHGRGQWTTTNFSRGVESAVADN